MSVSKPDGATRVDPDDASALIPSLLTSRVELVVQ